MTQQKQRWMGIDFGQARIGIAISDPLGMIARRLETINWNGSDMEWAMKRIQEIISENSIEGIVVGLPRRTDGRSGSTEELATKFAAELQIRTGMETVLRDERYTTVIAGRYLSEAGIRDKRKRNVIDQVAAEILLQEFLESRRR